MIERRSFTQLEKGSFTRLENGSFTQLENGSFTRLENGSFTRLEKGIFTRLENGSFTRLERGSFTRLRECLIATCMLFIKISKGIIAVVWILYGHKIPTDWIYEVVRKREKNTIDLNKWIEFSKWYSWRKLNASLFHRRLSLLFCLIVS